VQAASKKSTVAGAGKRAKRMGELLPSGRL
jgi:hypothetical protein